MTSHCPSWDHDQNPVPVEPGRRTCAAHLEQEELILRTENDLIQVHKQVSAYESTPKQERHGDEAKAFLESAIQWFFDQELKPLGLHCASGFRRNAASKRSQQLDVIVALHTENDSNWSIDLRILRGVERTQVFMHTEINYRSTAIFVQRFTRMQ